MGPGDYNPTKINVAFIYLDLKRNFICKRTEIDKWVN